MYLRVTGTSNGCPIHPFERVLCDDVMKANPELSTDSRENRFQERLQENAEKCYNNVITTQKVESTPVYFNNELVRLSRFDR